MSFGKISVGKPRKPTPPRALRAQAVGGTFDDQSDFYGIFAESATHTELRNFRQLMKQFLDRSEDKTRPPPYLKNIKQQLIDLFKNVTERTPPGDLFFPKLLQTAKAFGEVELPTENAEFTTIAEIPGWMANKNPKEEETPAKMTPLEMKTPTTSELLNIPTPTTAEVQNIQTPTTADIQRIVNNWKIRKEGIRPAIEPATPLFKPKVEEGSSRTGTENLKMRLRQLADIIIGHITSGDITSKAFEDAMSEYEHIASILGNDPLVSELTNQILEQNDKMQQEYQDKLNAQRGMNVVQGGGTTDMGTQANPEIRDMGTQVIPGTRDMGTQVNPETRDVEMQAGEGQIYIPPRVQDVPSGVPPIMPSDARAVSGSYFLPESTSNASYLDDSVLLANIASNYDSLNRPALAALGAEVTYKRERPVASQNEFRENLYGPRISGAMIRQLNRVADTDLRPLKQNVDIKLTQLRNDLVSFLDSFIDEPVIEGPSSYKTKPKDFYEYDPMEVQIPEDRERIMYETSKTTNEQDDEANPQATSSNILIPEDVDDTFKFVQRGSANYIVKKLRQSGLKALIGPYSNLFTSMYAYMNDSRDDKIQNVKGAIGLLVNALQQYQFQVGPYVFQSLMLSCAVASSAIDSYMYHVTNIAKSKLTLQQYDQSMRQGIPPSIKSYAPY